MDFAMREIIFELLSVGRQINKFVLTPERFSIGLRAFLVVADGLQQKEGEPPMPKNAAPLPSGSTLRVKKTFINKTLTDDTAKSLGIHTYYPHVRKVFGDILRALDAQVGRPLMMTSSQNANKVRLGAEFVFFFWCQSFDLFVFVLCLLFLNQLRIAEILSARSTTFKSLNMERLLFFLASVSKYTFHVILHIKAHIFANSRLVSFYPTKNMEIQRKNTHEEHML